MVLKMNLFIIGPPERGLKPGVGDLDGLLPRHHAPGSK